MTQQEIAMLAAQNCTFADIEHPSYYSIKFDGIRCLPIDGRAMSRANIPLANRHVQARFNQFRDFVNNTDGELIVGSETAPDCYNASQSVITSNDDSTDFRYLVFDDLSDPTLPFKERQVRLRARFAAGMPDWCVLVEQILVESAAQGEELYGRWVDENHEGAITRHPQKPYKRGRSTKREQGMIKLKPREDSEFVLLDIIELQRNTNEARIGERGQTKRSSHKAGKVAGGTLGKFRCRDIYSGVEFLIGTFKGLKKKDRQHIFDNPGEFLNRTGVYSFCPVGVKTLPRQPSFKGWRDPTDMGHGQVSDS